MIFGYARVSKNDQSLDIQLEKLQKYGCDEIYQEKISGVNENRLQLNKLLERLREDDKIVVQRLDRLGRRMTKLIELINDFKNREIEFVSLENNIDTSNPMGMLLFSICAAFSEMERTLITERVKAGLYAAHKRGRKGGRPKSLTKDKLKTFQSLLKNNDLSVSQKCKMIGISRSVYYRTVNPDAIKS